MEPRMVFTTQAFADQASSFEGNLKRKVFDFLTKMQRGSSGGEDLKPPVGARDKRVRTARVDRDYRAVLVDMGHSSYGLVAVLKHDDAYDFASRLTVEVNPVTGGVEFVDHRSLETARRLATGAIREVEEEAAVPRAAGAGAGTAGETPAAPLAAPSVPNRLRGTDPQVLTGLGIDAVAASGVVGLATAAEVEAVADSLPTTQGVMLLELLAGCTVEEVRADYGTEEEVDVTDFDTALHTSIGRRLGLISIEDKDVEAAMAGALEAWRVWLHPVQRDLVEKHWNGPARVTGTAGTGKTVTAVHRAVHLARALEESGYGHPSVLAPVQFLTFTRNLATAIAAQVDALAGEPLSGQGIEVRTLDTLAYAVLRSVPEESEWLTAHRIASRQEIEEYARRALLGVDLDARFLIEEWEEVILTGTVRSAADYYAAPRIGRGIRLSRKQRIAVWRAVEGLVAALDAAGLRTFGQTVDRAARVLADRPEVRDALGVRHAVVDESQDLTAAHWRMLRALVPEAGDDLFIVGDAHQRIYGRPVPLSRFGILTRGRSRRLTVNYRTSREIFAWSLRVADPQADDLDEGSDELLGTRSVFSAHAVEQPGADGLPGDPDDAVLAWIDRLRDELGGGGDEVLSAIAVVRRDASGVEASLARLEAAGIPCVKVGRDSDDSRLHDGVRVMTMHRAKGLEYRAVAVRDAEAVLAQAPGDGGAGGHAGEDRRTVEADARRERNLVYVSATRARERLLVC